MGDLLLAFTALIAGCGNGQRYNKHPGKLKYYVKPWKDNSHIDESELGVAQSPIRVGK